MRPLPLLVLGESAILAVLGCLWLATPPAHTVAAPPTSAGNGGGAGAANLDASAPAG